MWCASAVKRNSESAAASKAMRSSTGGIVALPLCGDGVSLEPLKPSIPFPLYAALPRSEYCEGVRLLPARPPPFGSAFRVWRPRLRATRGGLPSSVPIRLPPCRDLRPRRGLRRSCPTERLLLPSRNLTLSALGLCRIEAQSPRPCGLRPGPRAVYASSPASRPSAQDSLRRGWLGRRRRESHPLESVGFVSAHQTSAHGSPPPGNR